MNGYTLKFDKKKLTKKKREAVKSILNHYNDVVDRYVRINKDKEQGIQAAINNYQQTTSQSENDIRTSDILRISMDFNEETGKYEVGPFKHPTAANDFYDKRLKPAVKKLSADI